MGKKSKSAVKTSHTKSVAHKHHIAIFKGPTHLLQFDEKPSYSIQVRSPKVPDGYDCEFSVGLQATQAIATFIRASNLTYCDGLEPPDYWLMVLFILFFGRADCSRVSRNWLEDARGLTPVSNIHTFYAFAERLNNNHLTQEKAHQFFNALAEGEEEGRSLNYCNSPMTSSSPLCGYEKTGASCTIS